MLAVFTPKRWELVAKLREIGPATTAQLARALERDYRNVQSDVAALSEWLAVQREEDGRVSADRCRAIPRRPARDDNPQA